MINVTEKLKEEILEKSNSTHWIMISINDKNYYVKPDDNKKEIIGAKLAELFNLSTPYYESILINRKNYSISRDLKELGDFHLMEEFITHDYDLNPLLNNLRTYPFYTKELEFDIIKSFLFDILFLNDDRRLNNWGIMTINGVTRVVLLDHLNIFGVNNNPFIKYNHSLYTSWSPNHIYEDFSLFLDEWQNVYGEEIKTLIELASVDVVDNILKSLDSNPISSRIYKEHYSKILDIINRKRGVQK